MDKVKLCIIGFGNASKEFCRILIEKKEELRESWGYDVSVTAIATKSRGSLLNHQGINLEKALDDIRTLGKFVDSPSKVYYNSMELITQSQADIMVELSTLSIEDGQPAINHIKTALDNSMNVITGNKGPIAWAYRELLEKATNKDLSFLHEATVMDGTPVFNLVKENLLGCKVLSFKGILNSTTNFILQAMETGSDFEESIREAQRRGFAEANPSLDIDGWDAAAKTAALANVLMNGNLTPRTIDRTGISEITKEDVAVAKREGKKIKLLCEGYIEKDRVAGKVHPTHVDPQDILSNIDATSSILCITTDLMGEICVVEKDPEIRQTAYGIYSDLLTIFKKWKSK